MVTYLSLLADMIEKRNQDEQQRLLLHRLVQKKNKTELEAALKGASKEMLEREDAEGRTALMLAVIEKQPDLVHILIAHGADPNHTDRLKHTPLILAAEQEDLKSAEILLNKTDLTMADSGGCTVVHTLIRNTRNSKGALKLLKMLLQGLPAAEFERRDERGCTPLFVACTPRRTLTVQVICRASIFPFIFLVLMSFPIVFETHRIYLVSHWIISAYIL